MKRLIITVLLFLFATGCTEQVSKIDWSWGPVAPMPKSSWITTAAGNSVITVGGTYWATAPDGKDVKTWMQDVQKLNTKNMQWESLPDYPVPVGVTYAACVNDKLYVIGGKGGDKVHDETYILDLSKKNSKWQKGPSLPQPNWGLKGGIIDNTIYIISGLIESESKITPNVLALDTANPENRWRHVADLPSPKTQWQFATACGKKLYLFGGGIEISDKPRATDAGILRIPENVFLPLMPQAEVFLLDVVSGKWKKLRDLPTPKCFAECVAIDDRYIVIVGGVDAVLKAAETSDNRPRISVSNQCWLYDTIKDSYKPLTPLKKSVCDQGLAYINGTLYVIAGEGTTFRTRTDLVQIGRIK